MTLLRVDKLSIAFKTDDGTFQAVRDLSFQLEPGESLAIVGESGSGKSVSTRAVMGLLDRRSLAAIQGSITFKESNDLVQADESYHRDLRGSSIAMIFQEPMTALNPVMRCGEQVAESVRLHKRLKGKALKNEVLRLFEEVLLPDPSRIYRAYPHELSGGQRQRVMIAMALSGDPELLIADEPTTALDVSVQATILNLLNTLRSTRQMALIFISHDLGVVRQIADRALVMYKGVCVEEGRTDRIFADPKHVYARALLQCRPAATDRGYRLPILSDFFSVNEQGEWIEKPLPNKQKEPERQLPDETLIKVTDLNISYTAKNTWGIGDTHRVIHDLAFDIKAGETLVLLGESGSGKSTLGRAIMKLIPYTGTIEYRGKTLQSMSDRKDLAAKMQLIYQDPYSSLNPRFRIGDALDEVLKVHGRGNKAERLRSQIAIMEKVGLTRDDFMKYPHEFSGGQRQRISIARALILNPEFLVCDESVSALDVSVQAQVLNLMKDLQQELNLTYLFITHDLYVARYIADRILVLDNGRIAELEEAATIFEQPSNPYTQQLLQAVPDL